MKNMFKTPIVVKENYLKLDLCSKKSRFCLGSLPSHAWGE